MNQIMAKSFLDELNYNEDTKEFRVYYQNNYMNQVTEWAYCHTKSAKAYHCF